MTDSQLTDDLRDETKGRCSERLRRRRISRKVSSAHARVKRTFALSFYPS